MLVGGKTQGAGEMHSMTKRAQCDKLIVEWHKAPVARALLRSFPFFQETAYYISLVFSTVNAIR